MYNEEMQDKAADLMNQNGLVMGRFLFPITSEVTPNVLISTEEDGPFWYGDIDINDMGIMVDISRKLNKTLFVENEQGDVVFRVAAVN